MILDRRRVSIHAGTVLATSLTALLIHPSLVRGQESIPAPFIRYSDLESGPNTGGQDNQGAFVTLYGTGFGSVRGSSFVTVGGGMAHSYPMWSDKKIVVQLGSAAASGDIVVSVDGTPSNRVPFVVRSGNIYFVSTTGSDSNSGTFAAPWRGIRRARDGMAPGDITYLMDGVAQTSGGDHLAGGTALGIDRGGTAGRPKALVAYPGATVTIGSTSLENAIRVPYYPVTDYVIAGLHLKAQTLALSMQGPGLARWRIVGNRISCPPGNQTTACVSVWTWSHFKFLGNEVTDTGRAPASIKQYHGVYFANGHDLELAWNWIHDNRTCHAVQFHDDAGVLYNLSVHDNLIHGDNCSGINFSTVDPALGTVEAYNNVIRDVGNGPEPPDGPSGMACIYATGYHESARGNIEVFNNTCVNAGAAGYDASRGAFVRLPYAPDLLMRLRNNVVRQEGQPYLAGTKFSGASNIWSGSGAGPGSLTGNIDADPEFIDFDGRDLHLRANSPAIDAGTGAGPARDFDANLRRVPLDLGAYEHGASSGGALPEIRIDDRTVTEGHSGTVTATFTVSLSAPSALPVSFQYATAPNTASAGVDYASASGTLTLPVGATSGAIDVAVNGDGVAESNETFWVNLSGATAAVLVDGQGLATIVDDDAPPVATPAMTSPPPGSTFTSSVVTFSWSAGENVSRYALRVGTTPGGRQIFGKTVGNKLSARVRGVPTDGRTIYVRLRWQVGDVWSFRDYTYTAASMR
jgi:hypothetical protein